MIVGIFTLSAEEHLYTNVNPDLSGFTAIDSGSAQSRFKVCESDESESRFASLYTAGESVNCVEFACSP